jgi:hypothetical protein
MKVRFCCPTCGAAQQPADECRRCKCDLRLFRRFWERRLAWRRWTLHHLRHGRFEAALAAARRYWSERHDDDAARLLSVTNVLAGRWPAALAAHDAATRRQV